MVSYRLGQNGQVRIWGKSTHGNSSESSVLVFLPYRLFAVSTENCADLKAKKLTEVS